MKISELGTDNALDVLCSITPFIENIVTDDDIINEWGKKVDKKDIQTKGQVYLYSIKKIAAMIPVCLKTHRNDCYEILSILNGCDVEVIAKQNILKTASQLREVIKDKDLIAFFKSFVDGQESG